MHFFLAKDSILPPSHTYLPEKCNPSCSASWCRGQLAYLGEQNWHYQICSVYGLWSYRCRSSWYSFFLFVFPHKNHPSAVSMLGQHWKCLLNIEIVLGQHSVWDGSDQGLLHVLWYKCVSPFSGETVFIHQILTYKDGPHTERIEIFLIAIDNIDIQMKQKELTKTVMMIQKNLWFPWVIQKYFSDLRVNK